MAGARAAGLAGADDRTGCGSGTPRRRARCAMASTMDRRPAIRSARRRRRPRTPAEATAPQRADPCNPPGRGPGDDGDADQAAERHGLRQLGGQIGGGDLSPALPGAVGVGEVGHEAGGPGRLHHLVGGVRRRARGSTSSRSGPAARRAGTRRGPARLGSARRRRRSRARWARAAGPSAATCPIAGRNPSAWATTNHAVARARTTPRMRGVQPARRFTGRSIVVRR